MSYCIEPEVSGQLGPRTIITHTSHPPTVTHLHFIFYGWLGDDLIECFPVFLVSESLAQSLRDSSLRGYNIKECEIELSEEFLMMQPNIKLPNFYWLQITGMNLDDFYIYNKKLAVSELAFSILSKFNLSNAVIADIF